MRVVEIDSLQLNSSLDTKIGTNDWYLQLLNLSHGFFEYRVSERVWYVSKVVQQLLEFEPDVQQSKSLFNNESINELIDTFLLSPDTELTQDLVIRHKHQPWETLLLKCEKVIDSKGDVIVRGLLLDLSFKKKQDLIDSQLQKLQALGQLTSGVSHDFNNQLNGILGYVALMKTMTNDDTLLRYMDGIERSVRHSTELTRQLLAFSHKPESKRMNIDLVQIVKDTVNMLKHTVDRRIKIELNIEPDEYFVLGNESQLNNAILNLCINARDAIKGQGTIELTLMHRQLEEIPENLLNTTITPNDYAVLEIKDTGSGIEPNLMSKIFKPFFTTKDVGKGTGMGLASVVETIRNHNGAIQLDSVVGKGTTFTLYLPINHGIEEILNQESVPRGVGKVLVIDDELSNLEITEALLESFGYSVTAFSDPKQAIKHYAKTFNQYDCILLDVIMPGMSGVEAFKAIKLINNEAKVILLTGVSQRLELDFILRHGVDAYVPKPVDHYTLSNGVYSVLNSKPLAIKPIKAEHLIEMSSMLNISYALERIAGNTRLYLRIAHNFRKHFYMVKEQLPQLIESNIDEAIRKVHTIKGLSAQLGADELYEYSKELESALNSNEPHEDSLSIFMEEIMDVMDELANIEGWKVS
ncbi:MAG: response regulator [Turicibacter sp.]|nr:response regulator [Turicibacter sp.]